MSVNPTKLLGVLGWPVSHSLSPQMHNAALYKLGMTDWHYQRLPVPPELFNETVRSLPELGFVGANVTIPHKDAALAVADQATERAQAIGAANTLSFKDDQVHADNTDAPGLIAAIGDLSDYKVAFVMGAGGSARAAVWALRAAGIKVNLWNRTHKRAVELTQELGGSTTDAAAPAELLVNCSPVGLLESDWTEALPITLEQLTDYDCLVDFAYSDRATSLSTSAREAGLRVIDGREVLLGQGAISFELWTGKSAPLETMRQAIDTLDNH